jgi:D-alanyl-D-alanine dipeptidase
VDLTSIDGPLKLDVRYATTNNFMGAAFYDSARAYLQRPAAMALERVAADLAGRGFGLIVFDGYRPWFVTKMFWEATPDSLKHFVAPPGSGSRHNRGAAVDVGLYDLRTGEPVAMPSGYDEFTERAYATYTGGSDQARKNRDLLRSAMEKHGFTVNQTEWWHFDHEEWREYPIMNIPFEQFD